MALKNYVRNAFMLSVSLLCICSTNICHGKFWGGKSNNLFIFSWNFVPCPL